MFAVYINFTSLRNSVGGVGSVAAWIRASNFGIDPMGRVSPQTFSVCETYDL